MKFTSSLLSIAAIAVACALPHAKAQYAFDQLNVERYTDAGRDSHGYGQYTVEHGILKKDGTFVRSISPYTFNYSDEDGIEMSPTRAEVARVAGKTVMKLALWDTIESTVAGSFSQNFSRSSATYPISQVPYLIVAPKGGDTNPVSGGSTGGSTGGTTGGGTGGGTTTSGTAASGARFANLSFRAVVPANGNIIPGVVVADTPTHTPLTVLIRVAGPTLGGFGVSNTLSDPKFTVYDSANRVVASNDNWGDNATEKANITANAAKVGAFALQDGSKDAAAVLRLAPGSYTAVISGPSNAAGEVIVEMYAVEN